MSTTEDFRNAPTGATASLGNRGRAMKIVALGWVLPSGFCFDDEEMERRGYTLDLPAPTTEREALDPTIPTTAREALEIAWELAHEVEPGQVIPAGTRYLELSSSGLKEYTTQRDIKVRPGYVPGFRTVEPFPVPEPSWIDAPAVIATCGYCESETLHAPLEHGGRWECAKCQTTATSRALTGVTPLYPER